MNVQKDDLILPFTDPEFVFLVILLVFILIRFQQKIMNYELITTKNYIGQIKLN